MNKKHLFKMMVLSALISFSIVSCSDDDDPVLNLPNATVTDLSFADQNAEPIKISGKLTWKAPSSTEHITKYVIYASADGKERTAKIGEVPVGTQEYTIKDLTNIGYLLVVAANADGESKEASAIQVTDNIGKSIFALYFLNSGKMGNNNSTLAMYDVETETVITDYFKQQNGRGLGDTAQDMIVYGDKMYIAVYGESTIEVTDLEAKSIKQIRTEGQPRSLVATGGKVYVTYYNGYVARIDTASLEVEAKVRVGRNPEQITIANNKLYVANSGGMDYNSPMGYDKTVSVVDIPSFTEEKQIEVALNPSHVTADEQGNVYVISMGNYADVLNTLQRIDASTGQVSTLQACPNATDMVYEDGVLYTYYSQYNANSVTITYTSYNTQSGATDNWIKDGTKVEKPFGLSAAGGNIYVSYSDYTNDGDIYGFSTTGKQMLKCESGGLNPMRVVLAQKDTI